MQVHIFQLQDCQAAVRYWIRLYDEGYGHMDVLRDTQNEYLACILRYHLVKIDDELVKRLRKMKYEGKRLCRWTLKPVEAMVLLFCYRAVGLEKNHQTVQLSMFFASLQQKNNERSIWRMTVMPGMEN